jgi:hypothetical protein
MKKKLNIVPRSRIKTISIFIIAILIIFGLKVFTEASIEGSPHDLSTKQCVMCHTPNSGEGQTPLWNNSQKSETYALFSSPISENNKVNETNRTVAYTIYNSQTHDMHEGKQPQSQSSFCLACHNGIFSNIVKNRGGSITSDMQGSWVISGFADVGNDLRDDHPVSFTYDPSRDVDDNGFPEAITVPENPNGKVIIGRYTGTKYPLFGLTQDQFECSTCHVAHYSNDYNINGSSQALLLRVDSSRSSMCRDCHTKR